MREIEREKERGRVIARETGQKVTATLHEN